MKHLSEADKASFTLDPNWLAMIKVYSDEGAEIKEILIDVLNKIAESEQSVN